MIWKSVFKTRLIGWMLLSSSYVQGLAQSNSAALTNQFFVSQMFGDGRVLQREASTIQVTVSNLEELADAAARNGQSIICRPGTYRLSDYMTRERLDAWIKQAHNSRLSEQTATPGLGTSGVQEARSDIREQKEVGLFRFSGHNNSFDCTGVTIEVDSALLNSIPKTIVFAFHIVGSGNTIRGLTIRDTGDSPTARGGCDICIYGDNNTLESVTVHVRGSRPYGYGDYLGKGAGSVVHLGKHSGVRICGENTTLRKCTVISRAFGHMFFIQGGINTVFEDCYAEGVVRPTDEMLKETNGPAFENGFRTDRKTSAGRTIPPGYMKSLSECGFRTYTFGGPLNRMTSGVRAVNCTAKNCRVAFAFEGGSDQGPVVIRDCRAIGCETGYFLGSSTVEGSSGDAMYGRLLVLKGGRNARVSLRLDEGTSPYMLPETALICGSGHEVTISGSCGRGKSGAILIGYQAPGNNELSIPASPARAESIRLFHRGGLPVMVGDKSDGCEIITDGNVEDRGAETKIRISSESIDGEPSE
jgi:hypothetical protein